MVIIMEEEKDNNEWISRSFSMKGFGTIFFNIDGTYSCIKEEIKYFEIKDEKEKRKFLDEFIRQKNNHS